MSTNPTDAEVRELITQEQKDWLGNGEWDIELMLRNGLVTEGWIYDAVRVLTDSPWYDAAFADKYAKRKD